MLLDKHIVVFGGSFNPPHIGHSVVLLWLQQALKATDIIVIPTYQHAFDKDLASFEHRMTMCGLMANMFSGVKVSGIERTLPHPNRTINLIREVAKAYTCPIALVVGTDILFELPTWYQWENIVKEAKIVVAGRQGYKQENKVPFEYYDYPIDISAVSSTTIRERIKNGQTTVGLLPAAVEDYIKEHGLYK